MIWSSIERTVGSSPRATCNTQGLPPHKHLALDNSSPFASKSNTEVPEWPTVCAATRGSSWHPGSRCLLWIQVLGMGPLATPLIPVCGAWKFKKFLFCKRALSEFPVLLFTVSRKTVLKPHPTEGHCIPPAKKQKSKTRVQCNYCEE